MVVHRLSNTETLVTAKTVVIHSASSQSPLIRVGCSDFGNGARVERDLVLPESALPERISVVCTEPFDGNTTGFVGRVSAYREEGFYLNNLDFSEAGRWVQPPEKTFFPPDSGNKIIRFTLKSTKPPNTGCVWISIDFRYLTTNETFI